MYMYKYTIQSYQYEFSKGSALMHWGRIENHIAFRVTDIRKLTNKIAQIIYFKSTKSKHWPPRAPRMKQSFYSDGYHHCNPEEFVVNVYLKVKTVSSTIYQDLRTVFEG